MQGSYNPMRRDKGGFVTCIRGFALGEAFTSQLQVLKNMIKKNAMLQILINHGSIHTARFLSHSFLPSTGSRLKSKKVYEKKYLQYDTSVTEDSLKNYQLWLEKCLP